MSLDVYLTAEEPVLRESSGIFVREDGAVREISRAEWDERNPGHEPTICEQTTETRTVYSANITHNLNKMADAAGIYQHLWRPDEIQITSAGQLIEPLRAGLERLRAGPAAFKRHNPDNGWGDYDGLVRFVTDYLDACEQYPAAAVGAWR